LSCCHLSLPGGPDCLRVRTRFDRDIAIYRLKNSKLTASQVWAQPTEDLVLADVPLVTLRDLKSYTWQTHEFTVTAEVDSQLAQFKRAIGAVGGTPFVVTAGGERIYLGALWYAYSSIAPQVPYIEVLHDKHQISRAWFDQAVGNRNDRRIYDALKRAGVLME
jgi:hypothetical protein